MATLGQLHSSDVEKQIPISNVLYHADGVGKNGARNTALGYIAMELDQSPGEGLCIYVRDTGIGLAKGLARSYDMKPPTDKQAVEMAMSLGGKRDLRRQTQDRFGGRSLEHARALLRRLKGTISIRTGGAMAHFDPAKDRQAIKTQIDLYDVQGTHIHLRIPSKWKPL